MSDTGKHAKRQADKIHEALDTAYWEPGLVANILTRLPGHIQYRIYLLVRAIIRRWSIDAKYQQYDIAYMEVYKWAERHDDGKR